MSTETRATTTLFLEVIGMDAYKTTPKDGHPAKPYVRLVGTDGRGRFARAYVWGKNADMIAGQIKDNLAPGEDIGTQKPIYELEGTWRDRKFTKDGETRTMRSFYTTRFGPVTGRDLELNRIRRQSNKAIREAESLRADGKIEEAYRKVAELVADLGHFPLDLPEMDAELDHTPSADEIFGEDISASPAPEIDTEPKDNPERTAAEHYRADNKINGAPPSDPEPTSGMSEEAKPEDVTETAPEAKDEAHETYVELAASPDPRVTSEPEEAVASTTEPSDEDILDEPKASDRTSEEDSVPAASVIAERPARSPRRSGRATRPGM
ncbi:hypothetical protein [Roseibium sp. RKSG952]|uniref:hypothetical protein n=1 Tax=Roseibium sp. RKSG952 TaxID=2529384 RepID=UPI0012BCAAAB|nr:hypothetical protein [Roseibium sp. RKSG952]MTH95478.1 hypothetical protein [Roseibium sp. RKSG952]